MILQTRLEQTEDLLRGLGDEASAVMLADICTDWINGRVPVANVGGQS